MYFIKSTSQLSLYEESIGFFKENVHALSSEIPNHLLNYWMTDHSPIEECIEIFTSFFSLRPALDGSKEYVISKIEIEEKFEKWQLLLTAISISRKTEIQIGDFQLFNFSSYDKISLKVSMPNQL